MISYLRAARIAIASVATFTTLSVISIAAEPEKLDRIVAVVGDQIILHSELMGQLRMITLQSGQRPRNDAELQKMQNDILEQMVAEQLFLAEAKKDTTISIRAEEVDQALEDQVARIASRFGTNEQFLQALAQEGLTLRDLKKKNRSEIEKQLRKQRLLQKKLADVPISRHEVEEFYRNFRDSIPNQPEGVKLAHILLAVKPSAQVEDSVKGLATELRKKIVDGADFETIASTYSTVAAQANGGDLGYVSSDDVVPEFARPAFALSVGEISGVVRTPFGYHIIKCEGKRDERLKLRHILLSVVPSAQDSTTTMNLADSLLTAARAGGDFAEMAKVFSEDSDTRAQGGELGWFAIAQLPPEFVTAVTGWKTIGEYKGPIGSQYGLHLLKLLEYEPEKKFTVESDFDRVKEMARQEKVSRLEQKWLAQIKAASYIDYRL